MIPEGLKSTTMPIKSAAELTQEELKGFILECADAESLVEGARTTITLPRCVAMAAELLRETLKNHADKVRDDHMTLSVWQPIMGVADIEAAQKGEPPDPAKMQYELTALMEGKPDELIAQLDKMTMPAEAAHRILMSTIGRLFEQSSLRMVALVMVDDKAGIGGFALMNQHRMPTNEQARMYVEASRNQAEEFKRQAEKKGYTFDTDIVVPNARELLKFKR